MKIDVHTNDGWKPVMYEEREDGWYVKPWHSSGFGIFAVSAARKIDVEQLIRKEYDHRY